MQADFHCTHVMLFTLFLCPLFPTNWRLDSEAHWDACLFDPLARTLHRSRKAHHLFLSASWEHLRCLKLRPINSLEDVKVTF